MTTLKKLKNHLNDRRKVIVKILEIPYNKLSPTHIHKLRVEIKKMDSLFDLLRFCLKDFKYKKTFHPFHSITKKAGKIRDIQIEETLIKKQDLQKSLSTYLKELREKKRMEKEAFVSSIDDTFKSVIRDKFKETKNNIIKLSSNDVKNYFDDRRKNFRKILNSNTLQEHQIHELRKQLKAYYYNRRIFPKIHRVPRNKVLTQMMEISGKWHDNQIVIKHLVKVLQKLKLNAIQETEIEKTIQILTKENHFLIESIENLIRNEDF